MSNLVDLNPFGVYNDLQGRPLNNGKVYIGLPNQDPRQYPAQVFWDAALTIPAAQPLRTVGGYVARNGKPANLYINGNYSLMVMTQFDIQVFYEPDYFLVGSAQVITESSLNFPTYNDLRNFAGTNKSAFITGSGISGTFFYDATDTTSPDNGGTIIVSGNGRRWKRQYDNDISVLWFGAVGDGVTDDLAAFNAALSAVGNNQTIQIPFGKTYKLSGSWVFPNTKRFITVEGNGSTIFASHNGDGVVLTSLNEGYGGHVLHNLTIRGPNVAYPFSAAELAGTSTGAAVRLGGDNTNSPSAYANEFHNCHFLQFRHGIYMQAALFCNFFGGTIKYNQYGVTIDGGQTNANNFYGVLIRENRVRGLNSTGNSSGALTKATCNIFYGGGFESNIPFRGDNPPGYSNGYPINMDVTGVGVAIFLTDSYDFVFDGTYFENQNYSVWINGSSDNNSFTHCRFAPSGNRIGGVLLDNIGTSFNTFSRCTMVSANSTTPNVETFNANQFNNQFLDCEGFTFIDANLVSKPYVRNNRVNQAGGGTPIGAIIMPTQGYISNLGEGTSSGTITGIGTASATLNVGGYGEIEFGSLITADTSITTISGMSKGQHLTIRNYQTARKVKIISSTDGTGLILLKNKRSVTMNQYGQEIHLYCNSQGKVYEVGRNFSDNVSGFAQISGTNTFVDVVFENPEPDTNYVSLITVNDASGSPSSGAWIVRSSAQTVNGFRINVQAAPGAGSSFYYNWQAVR